MNESSDGYYERSLKKTAGVLKKVIPRPFRLPLIAGVLTALAAWFWGSAFGSGLITGTWTRSDRWGVHITGEEGLIIAFAITVSAAWCWIRLIRQILNRFRKPTKKNTPSSPPVA